MLFHQFKHRLMIGLAVSLLFSEMLLPGSSIVRGQDCWDYNQCTYLSTSSGAGVTVQGPIKYQFHESVNLNLSELAANDFKSRIACCGC